MKTGLIILPMILSSVFSTTTILQNTAAIIEQVSPAKIYDDIYTLNIFTNFSFFDQLFHQLDKNINNIRACLLEYKDKRISYDHQQQLYISSMTRNLIRNHELLKILFQTYTNFYVNYENCSSISIAQMNHEFETITTDFYTSNIFVHLIEPTNDNKIMMLQLKATASIIKNIREKLFEFNLGNIPKASLYSQFKSVLHETIYNSDLIINQINKNDNVLSKIIQKTMHDYDIIHTNEDSFNLNWKIIAEISEFTCLEYKDGKKFSINIPILTTNTITLSRLQSAPIILNDHTLEILFPSTWILGDIHHPIHIYSDQDFNMYCHKRNNLFVCKPPPQESLNTHSCIYYFLKTSEVFDSCNISISYQTTCISRIIGYQNKTFIQVCQFSHRSWILPLDHTTSLDKFIQLSISVEQADYLYNDTETQKLTVSHQNTFLLYFILTSIGVTTTFYLISWACVFLQASRPTE